SGVAEPFPARFPNVELEVVHIGGRADIITEVEQGTLDCGILDRELTAAIESGPRFVRHPLFGSATRGFLYHQDNRPFAELAESKKGFRFDLLRQHSIILPEGDHDAVRKQIIPD